jgi:cell division protein FtsN
MAHYERGSHEHDDDVPVFDGGEDDVDDEGSHLPVVIVITILVLAAFGGVVWLAYNQGVARGRSDVPTRVAVQESTAAGQGDAQASAGQQIKIYQQPAPADDEASRPAAGAAKPVPALRSEIKPESKPAATQEMTAAKPETHIAAAVPQKPVPPPASEKTPVPQVSTVASAPPAQLSLAKPAPQKPTETMTAKPAVSKPVAKPAAASGSYVLQIGAYKSNDDAMAAWKTYQAKHASLLSGLGPDVQQADLGEKGTWYRLRVGSFADKAAASSLCDRLKAENGACFLAK